MLIQQFLHAFNGVIQIDLNRIQEFFSFLEFFWEHPARELRNIVQERGEVEGMQQAVPGGTENVQIPARGIQVFRDMQRTSEMVVSSLDCVLKIAPVVPREVVELGNVRKKIRRQASCLSIFSGGGVRTLLNPLPSRDCNSDKDGHDAASSLNPRGPDLPCVFIDQNAEWIDRNRVSRNKSYRDTHPHQHNVDPTNWLSRHYHFSLNRVGILAGPQFHEERL